jgi:hypothetical protein
MRNVYSVLVGNGKGKDGHEELGADGWIILKSSQMKRMGDG